MAKQAKKIKVHKRGSSRAQEALTKNQQSLITPEIIGYADALAHQYQGCGLDLDDLKQEARYGVCQAVLHFDPRAGVLLKTFATYYIKKYIIKAIEQYGSTIRLKKEDRAIMKILSLDVELSKDGNDGADYLEDDVEGCYIETLADELSNEEQLQMEREETVADMMCVLNKQERQAIKLIFGLEGTELSMRETAVVMKVRPDRVRQIYNKAMTKMEFHKAN